MAQKFGFYGLNKKLSIDKLNSKVGSVYFKPNKSSGKIISGIQRGANLKKILINAAKGKTPFTVNKDLHIKYGVSFKQRKKVMDFIEGGKDGGLSPERVKTNLRRAQRDRIDEVRFGRDDSKSSFAGNNVVSTTSINVPSKVKINKDSLDSISAKRLGIGVNNTIKFAGEQPNKPVISTINPSN